MVFQDRRLDQNSTATEWPTSRSRPGNYLLWFWGAICSVTLADSTQCLGDVAVPIPQPIAPVDPGSEQLPVQTVFPFRNFGISDSPYNWDYSFRAGIFAGDYENVAIGLDNTAWAMWTDARNGRSSRMQAGRNPICEQSDAFVDTFSAQSGGGPGVAKATDSLYAVTPCPVQAVDT